VKGTSGITYLSKNPEIKPRLLEEFEGDLAGDDTRVAGVCLSEKLAVNTLLLGSQAEVRCSWRAPG
jgi:hypothetical protein